MRRFSFHLAPAATLLVVSVACSSETVHLEGVPEWVPQYPGTQAYFGGADVRANGIYGLALVRIDDPTDEAIGFYLKALREMDFEVQLSPAADGATTRLAAASRDNTRRLDIAATPHEDGGCEVTLHFVQPLREGEG